MLPIFQLTFSVLRSIPDSCILFCVILYREVPKEKCLTKVLECYCTVHTVHMISLLAGK